MLDLRRERGLRALQELPIRAGRRRRASELVLRAGLAESGARALGLPRDQVVDSSNSHADTASSARPLPIAAISSETALLRSSAGQSAISAVSALVHSSAPGATEFRFWLPLQQATHP